MKIPVFEGSGTAMITPFTADKRDVDYSFFEELCEYQIQNKTDALIIAGTTGESPVLSKEEKQNLFRRAVEVSGNRIPIIAGTGSNNTQEAVRKANDAEKEGVNAILVVTPYYNKCTQEGLVEHYFYIADRVSVPIIVYNVPSRTGFNISPETYQALSEHKNINAVKEANGDLSAVARTKALCKNDLFVYSGNDDQTVSIMALGGKGVISVASNIIPAIMHDITALALKNDIINAGKLQLKYLKLMNSMFDRVNPIPVKMATQILWNKKQPLRLPLNEMSEPDAKKLKSILDAYGLS